MSDIFIKSSENIKKDIPPYEPYMLSIYNFKITDDLTIIKDKIDNLLLSVMKGAYIFDNDTFSWKCILYEGYYKIKFNINIFKTFIINEYIIELIIYTRNYGSKCKKLFNNIKNVFNLPYEDEIYHDWHFQIDIDKFEYNSDDINETINNYLKLSEERSIEALDSSIHCIYDMSLNYKFLPFLFRKDILDLFKKVLNETSKIFDSYKHATIMTIGHFVDNEQGLKFINDNLPIIIEQLIALAGNGDYTTIYHRRESARILAKLSIYKFNIIEDKSIEDDEIRDYIIEVKK
jgi:hypothetical protein